MSFITLTTDFGTKDYAVSSIKGAIYSLLPNAIITDISHQISPFNINETAYILKNSYDNFPKNTVHIVGTDVEKTPENKHIAISLNDHYFICADNGILSLISPEKKPTKIVEINIDDKIKTNFPVLNTFVNVACHLAKGGQLNMIGTSIKKMKRIVTLQPQIIDNSKIIGTVIYIDHYGNVIFNVSKNLFEKIGRNKKFKLSVGRYTFDKIYEKYSDIENFELCASERNSIGNKLALFNSENFLEIAIYKSNVDNVGSASSLLGLNYKSTMRIEFL